jgi:hypothetical protein
MGAILIATILPTVISGAAWHFFIRDQPGGQASAPTGSSPVTTTKTSLGGTGNPATADSTSTGNSLASAAPLETATDANADFFETEPQGGSGSILPEIQPAGGLADIPDSTNPESETTLTVRPVFTQQPVPDEETLESARKTVRELFRDQFSEAKTPAAKHALARELFQQGIETDDNPAACYVLLQEAIDLAVEVGDFPSALRTIGDLSGRFEVDRIDMALDVIREASGNVRLPSEAAQLTEACMMLSEFSLEDSRYDVAALLIRIAGTNATRSKIPGLKLGITQMKLRVAQREAAWKIAEEARTKLESTPDDSAAHEQLGLWLCFAQKEWEQGLPHLARSDDADLQAAIVGDQSAPFGSDDRTKVAEAWLKAAEARDGLTQARFQMRARHWLNQASELMSGVSALQVKDQVDQLDKQALGSERTWLSELQPVGGKLHRTWKLGIGQVGVKQDAIIVNSQKFPRGLGTHPQKDGTAMVQYALDGKYRTLVTPCAVIGPGPRGDIQFSVIGDDKLLWWSRRVNRTHVVQTCNVDVRGVRFLELRVSVLGSHWGAQACWLDPFLLKSEPPKGLELP